MKKKILLFVLSMTILGSSYSQKKINLHPLPSILSNHYVNKNTKTSVYVLDSAIYYGSYTTDWEPTSKDISLAFDNLGRVVSSEHYNYSSQWDKKYLLNTSYMNNGNLDIYLKYPWNSNTLSFSSDTMLYYNLLPYEDPIWGGPMFEDKYIALSWDYTTNQFTGGFKAVINIISDSLYDNLISYDYNPATSTFILSEKYEMFYNSNNLLEYEEDKIWVDSTNSWVNDEKYTYAYDANGNIIQIVYQYWDNTSNSWENDEKTVYTYDSNNNKTAEENYNWDNATNSWIGSYRAEYTYDANGNILTYVSQSWNSFINDWENSSKNIYQYDTNNNKIEDISQYWNNTSSSWVNNHRYLYTYDANNNKLLEEGFDFNSSSSTWVYNYKIEYTYNANNDLLTSFKQFYNETSGIWINNSLYTYTYDSAYNKIQELYQTWNSGDSTWHNMWKKDYFYSLKEVNSVNELNTINVSIYPNPTEGIVNIDNSMAKIRTLYVYNMAGKLVYVTNDLQIGKVQIDLSKFGNGIYTLKMKDKKGNSISKRIIVN